MTQNAETEFTVEKRLKNVVTEWSWQSRVCNRYLEATKHPAQLFCPTPDTPHFGPPVNDVWMSGKELITAIVVNISICSNCEKINNPGGPHWSYLGSKENMNLLFQSFITNFWVAFLKAFRGSYHMRPEWRSESVSRCPPNLYTLLWTYDVCMLHTWKIMVPTYCHLVVCILI